MSTRLIKRPRWYRLFARRRWDRLIGNAPTALVDVDAGKKVAAARQRRRSMKGVVGA